MTTGSTDPAVYVVMPTWNQREDTLACLASVYEMAGPPCRVILVDNGSSDGTGDAVRQSFPQVQILRNEKNRGFAAAVNQGLRCGLEQGAGYLLVLNNDTIMDRAMLEHLLAACDEPRAGMVVPKICYYKEPNVIWSVGAMIDWRLLELTDNVHDVMDDGRWEAVTDREFATACAALLPRRVIEDVGFLDERFFYYYDDMDWSLRVVRAGYRILLAPQAKLWHKVARASGGVDTPYHRYWNARSSVLYFHKHVRGRQWLIVVPYRLGSAVKTTARLLLHGRAASVAAYWRGLRDGVMAARQIR